MHKMASWLLAAKVIQPMRQRRSSNSQRIILDYSLSFRKKPSSMSVQQWMWPINTCVIKSLNDAQWLHYLLNRYKSGAPEARNF